MNRLLPAFALATIVAMFSVVLITLPNSSPFDPSDQYLPPDFSEDFDPASLEAEDQNQTNEILQSAGTAEQLSQELLKNERVELYDEVVEIDSEDAWLERFENNLDVESGPKIEIEDSPTELELWLAEIDTAIENAISDLWELEE